VPGVLLGANVMTMKKRSGTSADTSDDLNLEAQSVAVFDPEVADRSRE
jgi:hypothetical protein